MERIAAFPLAVNRSLSRLREEGWVVDARSRRSGFPPPCGEGWARGACRGAQPCHLSRPRPRLPTPPNTEKFAAAPNLSLAPTTAEVRGHGRDAALGGPTPLPHTRSPAHGLLFHSRSCQADRGPGLLRHHVFGEPLAPFRGLFGPQLVVDDQRLVRPLLGRGEDAR
jgi:hypothetical protein